MEEKVEEEVVGLITPSPSSLGSQGMVINRIYLGARVEYVLQVEQSTSWTCMEFSCDKSL
jgi:hypothetical protein